MYQSPRTEAEQASFRRAFAAQDIYFAHSLATNFLVTGQNAEHLEVARHARGWPFYEDAIALLLKRSPPRHPYELPYHPSAASSFGTDMPLVCPLWNKVVAITRTDGGPTAAFRPIARTHKPTPPEARRQDEPDVDLLASKAERAQAAKARAMRERQRSEAARDLQVAIRDEAAALLKSSRAKPPPLAPSVFAHILRGKAFADGLDCGAIAGLYRAVLEDGFGGLCHLHLSGCGWSDADVRVFARTLREVRVAGLETLDLSDNDEWRDGEALAEAFETFRGGLFTRVPLRRLRTLTLSHCVSLVSLPSSLGRLAALEGLDLTCCESLQALPDSVGDLGALRTLLLADCFALAALPTAITRLHALTLLNLDYCDALTQLPDLSLRADLTVELLPKRLSQWEAKGRRAFDFNANGPAAETRVVDLSFLGTPTLPAWLPSLAHVHTLNLTGCEALQSLDAIAPLSELRTLKLTGCRTLTSLDSAQLPALGQLRTLHLQGCDGLRTMPNLSARPECDVVGLPEHLLPWLDGGCVAWQYDPNAPPLPRRRWYARSGGGGGGGGGAGFDGGDGGGGGGGGGESERERAGRTTTERGLDDSNGTDDGADSDATDDGRPTDGDPALAPQRLDLCGLDWGDTELFKVGSALADGHSINGVRVEAERLTALDLRDNTPVRSVNVLGKVLRQLTALERLDLSGCLSLQGLPAGISLLEKLRELDLSGCTSMLSLPESFCEMASLEHLTLGNALAKLPDGFGRLSRLLTLHAANLYRIQQLPPTWDGLACLEELHLPGWSNLATLDDRFFATAHVTVLHFGSRPARAPLTALPASVRLFARLSDLDLQDWLNLAVLPDAVGELRELRSLQLHGCRSLRALPDTIGNCAQLENLDLGACVLLSALPPSLERLAALVDLDVSGCAFEALPACVGRLPSLKRLNTTGCAQLLSLGDAFAPPALEALTLNDCHELRSVPGTLSTLVHLQQLCLNECAELMSLPDVTLLTELTQLSLVGCGGLRVMPTGLHSLTGCMVIFDDGEVVVGA